MKNTQQTSRRHIYVMLFVLFLLIVSATLLLKIQSTQTSNAPEPIQAAYDGDLVAEFEAESGQITSPFVKRDTFIYQTVHNPDSVSGGGVAKYNFTAPVDGIYVLEALVLSDTDAKNSFYIDIDKTPEAPYDIWDTKIEPDWKWKVVTARGNGTFDNNQFKPAKYSLKKGSHQLIIIGREPNTWLGKIRVYLDEPTGTATPPPVTGNLIPNGDFETGSLSNFRSIQECCSYSTQIVTNPVRAGKYAVRFELRDSDPLVASSQRVEITSPDTEFNKDYWYRFSVFLPTDWKAEDSKEIVDQWHNHPNDGEDYRNPALSLRIGGKNWGLRSVWDSAKITEINKYDGDLYIDLGPYKLGVWTDWAFHVKWSYTSTGFMEVFKNGQSVYKRSGPNTFNDPTGPYFKFGIYKWDWRTGTTNTTKRVLYQDNVSITQGN